ncbi:N-alpha-acetyltransferase 16 NatA auxiliary subunit [Fasciola hepatica]|uniref:N-alpha-acetyltransferase 16 NatA auxiliary subunit n=1 Tax=Fasciola hepatica TaxID=6192 RepID=A0A4E0QY80_FASHE|nr:N-alpha-acetyltransferase 16 NatA auxiliary subunit [Fasciola hepatica]
MSKQLSTNSLPPKELSIFKRVVKYYDQKQYKNGLKCAKQILSNPKFSEHGETLAMKGILLSCLGKKEEAQEYVKRGLKANISSFVCKFCFIQSQFQGWHIYGLVQKSDRKYDEAIKCYLQALRLDPDNLQVLRDLSVLQMQLRNYEGCKDTRYKLLMLRPSQRASWVGYALIHHLLENYDTALTVLNEFRKGQGEVSTSYENSELILYQAMILLENKKHEEALKLLVDMSKEVVDVASLLETKGEVFKKQLDGYLRHYLQKGAPPLFILLSELWKDKEKLSILDELLSMYRKNMASFHTFDGPHSSPEPPSTAIWLSYFIAQYLNFHKCYKVFSIVPFNFVQEALDVIDDQLEKTPTLVDFYVLKADIYYSAGDVITASRWMEEAQSLDTADRYINARCTRFMVEAHRQDDALAMASKFTRETVSAADYLSEMQCMWFLTENARTYRDMGKYGESLKLCHEVEQHYRNILDDQLDFHSYCLRKGTLRAYIQTIRLEDRLRNHPSYFDVAKLAIEIYLHLHAQPLGADGTDADRDQNNLSTSEAKKLRNKQRKAARKAEAEAARVRAEQERREQAARSRQVGAEDNDTDRPAPADSGLDPNILARPTNPLEEASNFLTPLMELSPKRIEVHCLAYEIYERKNKLLLMLKAIKLGRKLAGSEDHPWFHNCCVRFLIRLQQIAPSLVESSVSPLNRVLTAELPSLFEGWPSCANSLPDTINDQFLKRNKNSFPHVFRGVFTRCFIEPDKRMHYLSTLPLPSMGLENTTWQSCAEALNLLRTTYTTALGSLDNAVIENYRLACKDHFPMANVFLTSAERNDLRSRMVEAALDTAVSGVYVNYNTDSDVFSSLVHTTLHQSLNALCVSGDIIVNGEPENSTCSSPCKAPVNNINKKIHTLDTGRTQLSTSTF